MTQTCGEWQKYVGNGLGIWQTAYLIEKMT